ncbi:MAG: VCBS repeat-containing protein, partial [Cyclobacteriaceae bacterium]
NFVDFNHEPLLPQKFSQEGPGLSVGDVDNDGLEDLFVGGALLTSGQIFRQKRNGTFESTELSKADRESEDMGSLFFDADNDNDLDLYVVSGGNEYNPDHRHYQDRLYFNDGTGNFTKNEAALPKTESSGSGVIAADYDHDGDLDLFVAGRVLPTAYPKAPGSYLLRNNGKGTFEDVTASISPGLERPGMITTALWTDFDNDTWADLILAGEYMPLTFFRNENGSKLTPVSQTGLENTHGWWKSLAAGDFDNDGDIDYIAGNFGLNSHYRATVQEPINVTFKDFDNNGALEAITSYYEDGVNYPTASLDVLTSQLPVLKRKILYHRTYANTSTGKLVEIAGGQNSEVLYCKTLESGYIQNEGQGKFLFRPFPIAMQTAPIYGMLAEDLNADGKLDFIAVGNSYAPDVVSGRCDAFIGQVMLGDGNGNFHALPVTRSGFFVNGDAKAIAQITARGEFLTVVSQNNDSLKVFRKQRDILRRLSLNKKEVTAIVTFKNGGSRRMEIGYGSTYLSQTSRSIAITPETKKIELRDGSGQLTRSLEY